MDDQGPAAYRTVLAAVGRLPELGIDPFEVRVVGAGDAMAQAAMSATKPKPHPGMIRFNDSSLSGVSVDGAYIYPPLPMPAA